MNLGIFENPGIAFALAEFEKIFGKAAEAASRPKRDPILGKIVNLPDGWQAQKGYTADWAKDITQGRIVGRGMDTDWNPTGDISVVLLNPDGTQTGHSVSFEQFELSLAQVGGIKEAS